ncbi:MAG: DUF5060 domain-containing protein, partial [Oscillospiraceae bacterium]|nr:DUF5060 domain-containing protein [Oscillospiraceae bacterium]
MNAPVFPAACERWGVYELALPGRSDGNPFADFTICGEFRGPGETKTVPGFYDGDGVYRVRFMPGCEGIYTFTVSGTFSDQVYSGSFEALPPSPGNHGPVRVAQGVHFDYADGTPHYSIGTTCYVWHLQSPEMQEQTLDTLSRSPFNKIRFCVFPKHYDYNLEDPSCFPFEGTPCDCSGITRRNFMDYGAFFPGRSIGVPKDNRWDFSRFVPEYFRHLDETVGRLAELGIEADVILFHPYDRWGFSCMTREQDEHYLRYVIARLAAYRNVWWSMANEYDLLPAKTVEDWDHLGALTRALDPYGHLCSIHNCMQLFDF